MNWAHRNVLIRHGWKQSQCDGSWFRPRKRGRTEFVAGPYIPRYEREVRKELRDG